MFLKLWLSQQRLASCCACICGKRPKHFIEDMNFETKQTLWNLSTIKTEQNEVHVPTANEANHLSALITLKFSAKITYTPGILTAGNFLPDRSGGHVVPRWKSPDVKVDWEFGWKSADIMVSGVRVKITHVVVSVSSDENHPTLWSMWVQVKITPRYG